MSRDLMASKKAGSLRGCDRGNQQKRTNLHLLEFALVLDIHFVVAEAFRPQPAVLLH
jgi:hypothetical protein